MGSTVESGSPARLRFVEHVGLRIEQPRGGSSRCTLQVQDHHLNFTGVVHGGVLFTLADTGMGAALYPTLHPGQICATIEIKINYFKPVTGGVVVCTSEIVNKGKTVANLEACVYAGEVLVAKANGSFAILTRKDEKAAQSP
jgi:acyl-CoA thioesterase